MFASRTVAGFLVVRRLHWKKEFPNSEVLKRSPAAGLSHEEVESRYGGFEGEHWPGGVFDSVPRNLHGLVEPEHIELLLNALSLLERSVRAELLFLRQESQALPSSKLVPLESLGFEFGYFSSQFDRYSVILNEVLFGNYEALRAFGSQLNANLLLGDKRTARFLAAARQNLVEQGADLESADELATMEVLRVARVRAIVKTRQ